VVVVVVGSVCSCGARCCSDIAPTGNGVKQQILIECVI